MSEDIRISIDFLTHRKRKKLQKELGADGVLATIDLWLSTARQRPLGSLTGYTVEDIEIDANWCGEPGLLVDTLLKLGFLDYENGVYSLHNWESRQSWVVQTGDRSDRARFSRLAKINRCLFNELQEKGISSLSQKEYKKLMEDQRHVNEPLTVVEETLTPAPAPAPSPNEEKKKKKKATDLMKYLQSKIQEKDLSVFKDKIMEFLHYRKTVKKAPYKSEKGIDGFIADCVGCLGLGFDLVLCLERTMQKEWLTPDPAYFSKNGFNGSLVANSPIILKTTAEINAQIEGLLK